MRTLILGAGGQIGAHLVAAADRRDYAVQGTWYRRPLADFVPLDLLDAEAVEDVVRDFEPAVIHIAAGMSRVDYAQSHAVECEALAAEGTENVVRAAAAIEAKVVLYTSDQVVGECVHPADEAAVCQPMSVYGRTQLQAEELLRSRMPHAHLIVRTSAVYGPHDLPRNPALHAVRRLRDGHTLTAASDRYFQPTFGPELAEACLTLLEKEVCGTMHIVGGERLTEAAFFKQIAFIYGFDCDAIEAVPAEALCEDAARPLSPWLDRSRFRSLLGSRAIGTVAESLRSMRNVARTAVRQAA